MAGCGQRLERPATQSSARTPNPWRLVAGPPTLLVQAYKYKMYHQAVAPNSVQLQLLTALEVVERAENWCQIYRWLARPDERLGPGRAVCEAEQELKWPDKQVDELNLNDRLHLGPRQAPMERAKRQKNCTELVEIDLSQQSDNDGIQVILGAQTSAYGREFNHHQAQLPPATFICRCPALDVDDLRQLSLNAIRRLAELDSSDWTSCQENGGNEPKSMGAFVSYLKDKIEPKCSDQLLAFGSLTRNKLARRLDLARKCNRFGHTFARDHYSLSLYRLEQLTSEANEHLGANLAKLAHESCLRLARICWHFKWLIDASRDSRQELFNERNAFQVANLRQPVLVARRHHQAPPLSRASRSSGCWRKWRQSSDDDSGVSEPSVSEDTPSQKFKLHFDARNLPLALEKQLRLRSSQQIQTIICYSCKQFAEIVASSALFRFDVASLCHLARQANQQQQRKWHLLTVHQLKLFACVECQKMRATMRFNWLDKCLLLAFGPNQMDDSGPPSGANGRPAARLPPIEQIAEQDERQYFDLLAMVLGHLLRAHFLAEALECWCRSVETHLDSGELIRALKWEPVSGATSQEPVLSIPVELVERELAIGARDECNFGTKISELVCTRPGESLKEALGFVVDEVGGICCGLPRLETLLSSLGHGQMVAGGEDTLQIVTGACIQVHAHDLLGATKKRLDALIDGAARRWRLGHDNDVLIDNGIIGRPKDDLGPPASLVHADYEKIVRVVNQFRWGHANDLVAAVGPYEHVLGGDETGLKGRDPAQQGTDTDDADDHDDERLRQLELSCKQIRLLDKLEYKLHCKLQRYFDFGHLVRLDCGPLRDLLLKLVRNERLLLVRLKSDELFRLTDRLRLQFDEVEMAVDLESSIEDYLNRRWQAKQSQQPQLEQQVLLANEEGVDLGGEGYYQLIGGTNFDNNSVTNLQHNSDDQLGNMATTNDECTIGVDEEPPSDSPDREPGDSVELDEDEEFVSALVNNNNGNLNVAHLFALSNPKGVPAGELAANECRVAPLIECRLLVGRYEYFCKLLTDELDQLARDVRVAFEGLNFISEFMTHKDQQLELAQFELINELSCRVQEFGPMLADSLGRLDEARARLLSLNELRSHVLNKLVVEFNLLMLELSQKRLANPDNDGRDDNDDDESCSGHDERQVGGSRARLNPSGLAIRHLDAIQDTSDWAQKLELRLAFLSRLNIVLDKESRLLCEGAKLDCRASKRDLIKDADAAAVAANYDAIQFQMRASILDTWRPLASELASFWRMVDEFETQLVKWLNSDSKRMVYEQIKLSYETFCSRLELMRNKYNEFVLTQNGVLFKSTQLEFNMNELKRRLEEFEDKRLKIFKFLTNRHLNDIHWDNLSQLAGVQVSGQTYTTVAQLVELNADKFVGQLDEMSRQATIEHELSSLLMAEAARCSSGNLRSQLRLLDVSWRLSNWTDQELSLAASRFIRAKLCPPNVVVNSLNIEQLPLDQFGECSVDCHRTIWRYLHLSGSINLIQHNSRIDEPLQRLEYVDNNNNNKRKVFVLRSSRSLSGVQQLRPSLLIELMRLFTDSFIDEHMKLSQRIERIQSEINNIQQHLVDIDTILDNIKTLDKTDLQEAALSSEQLLANLERASLRLELEREILATKEALALERQQQALKIRDECVRQISERAIPAIRAATRALDCLGDGRCLRTLRSIRPSPPLAVRLVIEAVCLLRNSSLASQWHVTGKTPKQQQALAQPQQLDTANRLLVRPSPPTPTSAPPPTSAERVIDFVTGQIIEDYWPVAWRTLNGVHSSKLLADLRRADKKTIPPDTMRTIRRKYLSRSEFNLRSIERISRECALLARWLIAIDVFDRVINVVRPNYAKYLESERCLGQLFQEVHSKRCQIDNIGRELELIHDTIQSKVKQRVTLTDLLDECSQQWRQIRTTRLELGTKKQELTNKLARLERKRCKLINRCFWRSIKLVYLGALRAEDRRPVGELIRRRRLLLERKLWMLDVGIHECTMSSRAC